MGQRRWKRSVSAAITGFIVLAVLVVSPAIDAAPLERVGHSDMAWTVTDAAGNLPPRSFGGVGGGPWAGTDRIWRQPGFTGAYTIELDGREVPAYCGDFHNARSPDRSSRWVSDRNAFQGSDKALAKLSYAQWRWSATTDPDIGAALNLYTHFLGSPGDRSNSNGVPIPDINDNDVLDEVVTTLPPHADVARIMSVIDAEADSWSEAFGHRSAGVEAGVDIDIVAGVPVVRATSTGHPLPAGSYDLATSGRQLTVVTAGLARPLRDVTAGSQNSITAGLAQTARLEIAPSVEVTSQISDEAISLGGSVTDAIDITGLWAGETASVRVELFDLTMDPTASGPPLSAETRTGLTDGTTTGWASFETTVAVAGHRLGYRHRLEAIDPPVSGAPPIGEWSELGIVTETGMVEEVDATVHLRKTISSSGVPSWVNAQRGAMPAHVPSAAPAAPADGSHDDRDPDVGDALPVYVAGDPVSFRYEVWLDETSTADVVWPMATPGAPDPDPDPATVGAVPVGVVVDDAGTPGDSDTDGDDDFSPEYVDGDDGDGRLSTGEVWVFEAHDQRRAEAGERYSNVATVGAGVIVNPTTDLPTGVTTSVRVDPAGYAVPCLSTSVADQLDGDSTISPAGGTVVDTATFCNLVPGERYVITGVAVVKATGEPTEFIGSTTFVPDAPDGSVDVEIVVAPQSSESVASGEYVVFEVVTLDSSGNIVATHADLDDEAQTFEVLPPEDTTPPVPDTTPPAVVPPTPAAPPVPPVVDRPPTIPKVGSDAAELIALIGLALFTLGVVLMEARHGRLRSRPAFKR